MPFVVDVHIAFRLSLGIGGGQPVQIVPLALVCGRINLDLGQLLLGFAHLLQLLRTDILGFGLIQGYRDFLGFEG